MTEDEKLQLEGLRIYLMAAARRSVERLLQATNDLDIQYCRGRCSGLFEAEYLLQSILMGMENRQELPGIPNYIRGI